MKEKKIIAYKGFDKDLKCLDFQYKVGKTYIHEGSVEICSSGFHACLNPFDVLNYYGIDSRFSIVTIDGKRKTEKSDSKIASSKITINKELNLNKFIASCISYLQDNCNLSIKKDLGDSSQLAASGDYSKLAASGNSSQLVASGNYSKLASSGDYSQLAASGDYSQLAASGVFSKLAASGDSSQLVASGDYSQLAASGVFSQLASSGDYSQLAASGNYSKLAASGDYSKLVASGDSSLVMSAGSRNKIKGGENCAMALSRWVESEMRYRITVAYVGEKGIKPDTWYQLDDAGDFVEIL